MKISKSRIASVAAVGALFLNTLSPAVFAAESIQVIGNGSDSENEVEVNLGQSTTVTQSNSANVFNDIDVSSSTGENNANDNTGGDVLILTGDALANTDVSTRVNLNRADFGRCNPCNGDMSVLVSGNGFDSENEVELSKEAVNEIYQDNSASIQNDVDVKTKTGENNANRNTSGDTAVISGNAESNVNVRNTANANLAKIGTTGGAAGNSDLDVVVRDNGSESESEVELALSRSNLVVQNNSASVQNDVDVKTKTGENNANDNTGGDVLVDSGRSLSNILVDNLANFNFVAADCDCLTSLEAKVAGNGFESENEIEVETENALSVYQDNRAEIRNELENKANTGKNQANRNTEGVAGDPGIVTGHSTQNTTVRNASNANTSGASLELPNGVILDLHFDLSGLMAMLH